MNIVLPMAGEGSRFVKAGFDKAKPFIDVKGKPMIEHVIENLNYPDAHFYLLAKTEHILSEPSLVNHLTQKYKIQFITIDKTTEGAACTVLHARKFINNDEPLLIANSDQLVDINIKDFIDDAYTRKLHGSILTFTDYELNPKWSFAKTDELGYVAEVKEKVAISSFATVGIYLFSKGKDFVDAAIDMIIANDRVNNEFYTCPVYNYLIKNGGKIGIYNIEFSQMHGLGTPEDLKIFMGLTTS